jgi:hypothetical protein
MADATNVIIPGKGAIFIGEPGITPPNYKTMSPSAPGTGWAWLGNTSVENNVSLSKDGGDPTTYDGWWDAGIEVTYAATTWTITVNALEMTKTNFDLAFGGKAEIASTTGGYLVPSDVQSVKKSLFVLAVQGTKRLGLYLPNVSVTLGDAPAFDRESLFELPLSGNVLASPDGNVMEWFAKALDKAA